ASFASVSRRWSHRDASPPRTASSGGADAVKYWVKPDEYHGQKAYRIYAVVDIPRHGVKAGDAGGFIRRLSNLSQTGDCWIAEEGIVDEIATVEGNALVSGTAMVRNFTVVCENAHVTGEAHVADKCMISEDGHVGEQAQVFGTCYVQGNAYVGGEATVLGNSVIYGNASITGTARITGHSWIAGNHSVTSGEIDSEHIGLPRKSRQKINLVMAAENRQKAIDLVDSATKEYDKGQPKMADRLDIYMSKMDMTAIMRSLITGQAPNYRAIESDYLWEDLVRIALRILWRRDPASRMATVNALDKAIRSTETVTIRDEIRKQIPTFAQQEKVRNVRTGHVSRSDDICYDMERAMMDGSMTTKFMLPRSELIDMILEIEDHESLDLLIEMRNFMNACIIRRRNQHGLRPMINYLKQTYE
ncbi:MAG: hypothetical protein K2X45_08040, partial [Phreatobacter sp.]|nr:hypothetical protein [Phreatobacter sp.]